MTRAFRRNGPERQQISMVNLGGEGDGTGAELTPARRAAEIPAGRRAGCGPRNKAHLRAVYCRSSAADPVTWRGGRDEGRFHVVASGLSLWEMGAQLPRVFAGRPLSGRPHLDRPARGARIEFAEEQPYTLDGDLFTAREIDVAIGPRIEVVR